jgi:tripartite-type tricarboxylate transporter receptor subunit TctC
MEKSTQHVLNSKSFKVVVQLLSLFVFLDSAFMNASAQTYPDKPIKIIVAFAPGGLADTVARSLQPKLAESLGQPVLIENKGGAGGTLGELQVAKSNPDGYTMMIAVDSFPVNPFIYKNLNYDSFKDIPAVSLLAKVPLVLIVNNNTPANTISELIKYAQSKNGKFAYASPGTGTSNHLYMEYFKIISNAEMIHIPYKGGSPALNDLIGGQVESMLISVTLANAQVKSNMVKALAVSSEKRVALLPNIKTFTELGYPDFVAYTWAGLFLPAGTPSVISQKIHDEFAKAIRSMDVTNRFKELGAEVVMSTPAEFTSLIRSTHEKMGDLINKKNIQLN